jgi:nucleotide-binding universal stress UspA family protein
VNGSKNPEDAFIRSIVAATDFSSASDPALRYAVDLAERVGARVTLLHVYGLPIYPLLDAVILPSPEAVADIVVGVNRRLETTLHRLRRPTVKADIRSVEGITAESIVDVARTGHFDLIVLGTHGRSGLRRIALGSVAERVVQLSTTPVLTVRSFAVESDAA